jgi:hypothetical protein
MSKDSKTLFGLHRMSDSCCTEQCITNMQGIQALELG